MLFKLRSISSDNLRGSSWSW